MRIIAGAYGGRRINAPAGLTTRPTTDRVRESLFSSLTSVAGPGLGGGPVLDVFAGSGALGLEALSRGASPVTFVEKDRRVASVLRANIELLGATAECTVLAGDASSLAGQYRGEPVSLILLDPPYTLDAAVVGRLLASLSESGAMSPGALVSWEHAAQSTALWPDGFQALSHKRYGTTAIDIARYVSTREAT